MRKKYVLTPEQARANGLLGGRPRIELNYKQLKALCQYQCTAEECAAILDMSPDTLDRRLKEDGYKGFAEYFKKNSVEGKISLRRAQFKNAVDNNNTTMQVWLGKQYLGQTDKVEELSDGEAKGEKPVINFITVPNAS